MSNVPVSIETAIEYLKRTRTELLMDEHRLGPSRKRTTLRAWR